MTPRVAYELDVEGCFNVRDAGGWDTTGGPPMREGVLFRGDEALRMTPAGQAVIDGLNLQAVIDLRSRIHFERGPGFGDPSITHHVPVVDRVIVTADHRPVDTPADIALLYDGMVDFRRANLVRAIELIADHTARGPVLVHCMAGKDRTGIVVALVQAAIGVPLESIVDEYARSDAPSRLRRAAMVADPRPGDPAVVTSSPFIWTAPAEAMRLFAVQAIERHGSLEAWPRALGVTAAHVTRLRQHLLLPG